MRIIQFILAGLLIISCISIPKQYNVLAPGTWRGTLILEDKREVIVTRNIDKVITRDPYPESTQSIIPFNFNITYTSDSDFYFELINGKERIRFDSIIKGHDIRTGNDTMIIRLLPYDAEIRCIYENNKMSGEFRVLDKVNYSIPFKASFGQEFRFVKLPEKSNHNINGEWEAIFEKDSTGEYNAIAEFKQEGQKLTGTFRTETGDYRFLQGELSGNKLMLSAFDGAHAFMFQGEIVDDQITGMFYSGKHYSAPWEAKRMEKNKLINPDSVTKIISTKPLEFRLPNSNGEMVSIQSNSFIKKPKIIQITGSWCPNCRDETEFLKQYIKNHPDTNIVFIAIAFERYNDRVKGIKRIHEYKQSLNIPYEVLLGGNNKRDSSSLLFPQLDGIQAYPTMLFLNKDNQILRVHTGFDGPATSKYDDFKKQFESNIEFIKNSAK